MSLFSPLNRDQNDHLAMPIAIGKLRF